MEWIAVSVMFGLYFLGSCQDVKQLKLDHSYEILKIARNIESKLEGMNERITVMEGMNERITVLEDQGRDGKPLGSSDLDLLFKIFAEIFNGERDQERDFLGNTRDHIKALETLITTERDQERHFLRNTRDHIKALEMLITTDECADASHNCSEVAKCKDTSGGYTCTCHDGYEGDGFICQDTDECQSGNHKCARNSLCTNTVGNYHCVCLPGFTGDGSICKDIDECIDDDNLCHHNAECSNTDGTFECSCKPGYTGNGTFCQDIDECSSSHHGCHCHATCVNTEGGHRCVCPHGFTGNGFTCQDVDECQGEPSPCHVNADCKNTFPSFSCSCKNDYHGDGISYCEAFPCEAPARVVNELGCVIPIKKKKTWDDARIYCKLLRGQLLEGISSILHLDTLKDYFYHSFDGYDIWIGLRNLTWIERGDSVDPQSPVWKDGEPNQGTEECTYVCSHNSPRLQDRPCSETKEFYCQRNI